MPRRTHVDASNAGITPRAGYGEVLATIIKEGRCPFCEENLSAHHTEPVLFRNKSWIVTKNAWPYEGSKHHFLLIAREHVENADKASLETWKDLGSAYRKLCKTYALPGATLLMRSGNTRYTGASVQHLHAQVIAGFPRKTDSKPITALAGFQHKK
jgi:diadenosine tetraphosphate (Ap4A) HIT family hydrolase